MGNTAERTSHDLPPRWNAALWLVDVNGLPPVEAASRLGMSLPAVTALLARARHTMRQQVLDQRLARQPVLPEQKS